MTDKQRTLVRIYDRLDKSSNPNGCWEWQGGRNKGGYGKTWSNGRTIYAHRLMWSLHNGDIPQGMQVCHKCDNPPCCNPEHLFLGTAQENMADRSTKGHAPLGENVKAAKLSESQVMEIDSLLRQGLSCPTIAAMFDVHRNTVLHIKNGKVWAHTTGRDGSDKANPRKLTAAEVIKIDAMLRAGERDYLIAKAFSIDATTLSNIKNGRSWRQITGRVFVKPGLPSGESHHLARYPDATIVAIRKDFDAGLPRPTIAERYGVSIRQVYWIGTRKSRNLKQVA